ncbi:DUF1801 domain-containing protein [Paracoccus sp. (in: a-proteobacteria)]|uniref:DUF1801 domain-containing protein n=1 Tax=Paracoccus sp. TaxID=267 RepID=UPI003A89C9D9
MLPAIEKWFSELTDEQRKTAVDLRSIVLSQGAQLREEFKWGQPCFYGNSMVCYIQKAKSHVSLGFGKGASLTDPDEVLEGNGGQMRHVKLPLGTDADRGKLGKLVKQAIALDAVA